jgi:hypothetical protein
VGGYASFTPGPVYAVQSPSGTRAAVLHSDGTVTLHKTLSFPSLSSASSSVPTLSTPYAVVPGRIPTQLWRRCDESTQAHHGAVPPLAWSHDGARLATLAIVQHGWVVVRIWSADVLVAGAGDSAGGSANGGAAAFQPTVLPKTQAVDSTDSQAPTGTPTDAACGNAVPAVLPAVPDITCSVPLFGLRESFQEHAGLLVGPPVLDEDLWCVNGVVVSTPRETPVDD